MLVVDLEVNMDDDDKAVELLDNLRDRLVKEDYNVVYTKQWSEDE